jgi:hypothetical protein
MRAVTFAVDTTAVVDGNEDDEDIIEDSNVVGECVRTRLQFKPNRAVIVYFLASEDEQETEEEKEKEKEEN